ncbi:phospholipid-transporting ATPase ABCA3-like [Planococcus citri]|uniref:phospholipid-transporting ATPase ABCA3-like n=1 Tax=Planococcus citri TaxID=170843 RepID=UPI0031F97819
MLKLIVSLKGIKDIDTVVDEWIAIIGLEEIQNVRCDLYSNSSKRLLSTALSLVGNPRVVFLDEPAHDVDSMTRHHLYDIIEHLKHSGMTVVLGSSSSLECELLCDRLTILINGVMYCIGNTHDLKDHHSLGCFLMIRVHPDITSFREVVRLEKSILAAFKPQSCRLIEEYRSLLHYQIVDHSLPLSSLFLKMEEIKSHNPVVEEYIVTTTTIQDILESFSHPANFFSSRKVGASAQISEQEYQKDVKKIVDPIKY